MNRGAWVAEFHADCTARVPVAQLKSEYMPEDLRTYPVQDLNITRFIKSPDRQWNIDYFCWIVDAMDYPAHFIERWVHDQSVTADEFKRWGLQQNYNMFPCSLLDWLCLEAGNVWGSFEMIDFLLQRGFTSSCSLSWCLFFGTQWALSLNDCSRIDQRLLDAGANLFWIRDQRTWRMNLICDWYHSRQQCRVACIALLAIWRHCPLMRRTHVTRDIAVLMAKELWAQRWTFIETKGSLPETKE
jgi:hypothetical protein